MEGFYPLLSYNKLLLINDGIREIVHWNKKGNQKKNKII